MNLKAFTLIEMVVVMLLSSVVMGIVVSSYQIINKQLLFFRKGSSELLEQARLKTLIGKDFIKSDKIYSISNGINCINGTDTIAYSFNENEIIRSFQTVLDTFHINVTESIIILLYDWDATKYPLISDLILSVTHKKKERNFHYNKTYGADVLMAYKKANNGDY